jgi:hypothetical protein
MAKIALADPKWEDGWVCLCGNTPIDYGFYPCNEHGEKVEPTPEEWTTGCYVCDHCGRIIRQSDLEIVGRRATAN